MSKNRLENICRICWNIEYEGRICRNCREPFLEMADLNVENYDYFMECLNCDLHGFPCLNCAEIIFKGTLGKDCNEFSIVEILEILYHKINNSDDNKEVDNNKEVDDNLMNEEVIKIIENYLDEIVTEEEGRNEELGKKDKVKLYKRSYCCLM